MWRRKKFIIVAVLAATVLLVGGISTVAFAETGSTDNTTSGKTLLARVATILGIDQQTVENAFTQAQSEIRAEALDKYLQKLVGEGKITQAQAEQYKAWWQAMPDIPVGLGSQGHGGFRGMGRMGGMGGMGRMGRMDGMHDMDEMHSTAN